MATRAAAAPRAQSSRTGNRLLAALVDAWGQADIRRKLLFTFAMLVIFRFVAHVPLPGVDRAILEQAFEGDAVLGFLDVFSGGALRNLSIASLGVYPYVTSSIIMQLLIPMVPRLRALSQEGQYGRQRIQIYTHWITVPVCFVQGYGQLLLLNSGGQEVIPIGFGGAELLPTLTIMFTLAAGTMFLVWIGELITENGVGNGISVLIFGGIVAGLPGFFGRGVATDVGIGGLFLLALVSVGLIALIVLFQEAQRRIPVQYAKSMFRGGRMYRQTGATHIPLRINSAGMIPLIFAFSIMIFPSAAAGAIAESETGFLQSAADFIRDVSNPERSLYWIFTFLLVVIFTFFYTMVIFQQQNLADNLQRQGGFIPGIRPGRPTHEYIIRVLTRITWAGAFFLGFVAVVPFIASLFIDVNNSLRISATGMLIVVAVVLDTMKQLESQLLMRNYEGFIR
ncbi:MAG: preprotein translocase subunit SecY [Dehalococcoidia bacterium]